MPTRERLRTALVVEGVPPSGGKTEYEISFYRGKNCSAKYGSTRTANGGSNARRVRTGLPAAIRH